MRFILKQITWFKHDSYTNMCNFYISKYQRSPYEIYSGRSELVPEMPRHAGPTKIDYFVLVGYVIFAVEMFAVALIGDNHCGTYQWIPIEQDCMTEIIVFAACILIWIMGIYYVFVNKFEGCSELFKDCAAVVRRCCFDCCKCGKADFWRERSDQEFGSWAAKQTIDNHVTVDEDYMFGSDQKPIERGASITYDIY